MQVVTKGRIIEIYGPESSGKTTVALHAGAQTQKEGGIAAFIITLNMPLTQLMQQPLVLYIDELLLSQPDSGEQIAGKLIDSGAVDLVVVDSVAALVPRQSIVILVITTLVASSYDESLCKLSASINKTKQLPSLSTNCVKKLVLFGNPKLHLVDVPLNSTLQFV